MSAKIAAIVPVGYLDRMGYQHVWSICEQNIRDATDDLWIMNTIPWFGRKPDGSPWFDAYIVMEVVNDGIEYAVSEGFDAAIVLMCNNYIRDADLLHETAEQMLMNNEPFAWYYRMDQLYGDLFGPSVRLPWLVNLRHRAELRFSVDCLVVDGGIINMERGDYDLRAIPIVVDVQLEMTREDLAEKMNFIRCYADLVPKRSPVFKWGYWFRYYVDKFRQKQRRDMLEEIGLTDTGLQIAIASRSDFVSHEVLRCL